MTETLQLRGQLVGQPGYGIPQKRLYDHLQFISDVELFSDGNYALSGSWDMTLRLWDLAAGKSIRRFEYRTKDVLSVAFSVDNPNCKLKIDHLGHNGYLNSVSPDGSLCTSGGKECKAFLCDLNDDMYLNSLEHNDVINALCFSSNQYWLCFAYGL
ncbi:hypothetical protein quinque_012122 [Culex quinquefasciatus]